MQVNLRKTLYANANNGSVNERNNHYATINGENGNGGKLNNSVIVASDKQKSINVQANSKQRENYQ